MHPRNRHLTRSLLGALALGVLAMAFFTPGAHAKDDQPGLPRVDTSTILVKFSNAATATAGISARGDQKVGVTANGVHVVRLTSGRTVAQSLPGYRSRSGVVYAEPNYLRSVELAAPNDPSFGAQWGLSAIRALEGWSIFPATYAPSAGSKIAVVDTGVDSVHPDLTANIDTLNAAQCITGVCINHPALDDHGHGTHVAGIAAAVTNNSVGISGLGVGSKIMPVKVLTQSGEGSDAAISAGIVWGANHGARVINVSLGGYGYSQTLCNAIASATSAGALVVAAAGNDGSSQPVYPAACPGALGVAATASDGSSPEWSNWNTPNVFLSAPGASIYSTYWRVDSPPTYATLTGTSMATPHVAGLAALLLAQVPSRTPANVKQVLARTADRLGGDLYPPFTYGQDPYGTCSGCTWHPYYGYGEIDVRQALCVGAPPSISAYSPAGAPTGGSVTLTGANLECVTSVSLGFVPAAFTVNSPSQITATVPAGVGYGRWRVTTEGGTGASGLVFTVSSPTIATFAPLSGGAGSTVTITGSGFVGVNSVSLGFVDASFTVDSPTQITATVPAGPAYGRWRVASPLWTAADPFVFTVTSGASSPVLATPAAAPAGAQVTLTGSGFAGVSSVSLGFVEASFIVNSPTQITATVPSGVGYGRWRVTTGLGTKVDELVSTVTSPRIGGFAPASGSTGSTITITGSGFFGVNSVSLGFVAASFTVDSPTQITATVPPGPEYGRWRVGSPIWTAAEPFVYTVTG